MFTFSPKIQSLIDSSGREAALNRAVEIKQRVKVLENELNPKKSKQVLNLNFQIF